MLHASPLTAKRWDNAFKNIRLLGMVASRTPRLGVSVKQILSIFHTAAVHIFRVTLSLLLLSTTLLGACQNQADEFSDLPPEPASVFATEETLSIDPAALGLVSPHVEVAATQTAVRVTLKSGILFATDQDTLQPAALASLTEIAAVAKGEGVSILIEGHTDDVGEDAYNLDLSRRRAKTVADWLMGEGIATSRIATGGYGESFPRVPNTSPENRALNRRVEIVLRGVKHQGVSLDQISGHWSGAWGSLVLRKKGNRVLGAYGHDQGALIGNWQNGQLIAWWSEMPSREAPKDAGEVEFKFRREGNLFLLEGRWRKGNQGVWKTDWNLKLTEESADAELLKRFDDPAAFVERP